MQLLASLYVRGLIFVMVGVASRKSLLLGAVPELDVAPGDAHGTRATIGGVSTNLVVESAARSILAVGLLAVDVDLELLAGGVVNGVDANRLANTGGTSRGNLGATLHVVEAAVLLDTHDEVGAVGAMEGLLDGDAVARHGVDLEATAKLVGARAVVVEAALGTQVAVGAARAARAAIRLRRDLEGVSADAAASAVLVVVAREVFRPLAASNRRAGDGDSGSREGKEEGVQLHNERSVVCVRGVFGLLVYGDKGIVERQSMIDDQGTDWDEHLYSSRHPPSSVLNSTAMTAWISQ